MKKKSTYILSLCVAVALICIGIFDIVRDSQNPRTDDLKNIHVEIVDEVNSEILLEGDYQTNSEDLAGFLTSEKKLELEYEEGQYGLYITSLQGHAGNESAFWVFESKNNQSCAQDSSGYCPAAGDVILQDGDEFVFKLINQ